MQRLVRNIHTSQSDIHIHFSNVHPYASAGIVPGTDH